MINLFDMDFVFKPFGEDSVESEIMRLHNLSGFCVLESKVTELKFFVCLNHHVDKQITRTD